MWIPEILQWFLTHDLSRYQIDLANPLPSQTPNVLVGISLSVKKESITIEVFSSHNVILHVEYVHVLPIPPGYDRGRVFTLKNWSDLFNHLEFRNTPDSQYRKIFKIHRMPSTGIRIVDEVATIRGNVVDPNTIPNVCAARDFPGFGSHQAQDRGVHGMRAISQFLRNIGYVHVIAIGREPERKPLVSIAYFSSLFVVECIHNNIG